MDQLVYKMLVIGAIGVLLVSQSCSTARNLTPPSVITTHSQVDTTEFTIPQSEIVLSFEIAKHSIVDSFGVLLDTITAEPWRYDDQGIELQLARLDDAKMGTLGNEVLIDLPLKITVIKSSILGDMHAYGKINVTFISAINITNNWDLSTQTTITDYTWIERPKFNLGIITVPIGWISDEVIRRIKGQLVSAIDQSITDNFDLPQQMAGITETILRPYQLDSTVGGWIQMFADSTHLAPFLDDEHYAISRLSTPVQMAVSSRAPLNQTSSLPPFSWKEDIPDSTHFRLWVDLQYDYLTQMAKQNFVNRTFKNGNKEVKVEDLEIYGDDDLLYVKCRTSGSFNGEIIIAGQPIYTDGTLHAEHVKWEISTSNIFHKAASWLGKGYIHDQLNEMLVFDINDYLAQAKEEISTKLDVLKEDRNLTIKIDWGEFDISQLHTQRKGLQGLMEVKMKVHVIIEDLKKLY